MAQLQQLFFFIRPSLRIGAQLCNLHGSFPPPTLLWLFEGDRSYGAASPQEDLLQDMLCINALISKNISWCDVENLDLTERGTCAIIHDETKLLGSSR